MGWVDVEGGGVGMGLLGWEGGEGGEGEAVEFWWDYGTGANVWSVYGV